MARELGLIVEADEGGHVGGAHAVQEQLLRACDAEVRQVRVRRHADLRAKRAAQMELVEVSVGREIGEGDRVTQSRADVLPRAADGTRGVGMRAADLRERADRFGDRDLERQPIDPAHAASIRR